MARAKILVVEDESIIAKDIANTLTGLGYTVAEVASSGEDAIRKAAETSPDLVLMDIVLRGGMDGVEAAEQIRARLRIPIVYLTAYGDEETLQRAKVTEPFGYLIKPFQERELRSTIEVALYKHGMEKRLEENERWFATTLQSIDEGVITTDKRGIVKFMNPVAEALTDWKQGEAIGKSLEEVFQFVCEGGSEEVEDLVKGIVLQGAVTRFGNQIVLFSKDGRKIPIDHSAAPIRDDQGNITGVVLVFRDISERKRTEEAQKKLEHQLFHAQKMEAIGLFSGGIAHDFNNMLTVILGNADLLSFRVGKSSPLYESISEIKKGAEKAADLTRQILAFSRRQILKPTVASIVDLSMNLSKMLGRLIGEDIELKIHFASKMADVFADPTALEQVLINLTLNARHAMPQGGTLTIEGQNVRLDEVFCSRYPYVKPGEYVQLTVADTGIGMDEQVLHRIFEPFFTMKDKGTGLGLSVVYGIVKQHGGYIIVSSTPGQGSRFDIYLPPCKGAKAHQVPQPLEIAIPRGSETILVAEDEENVRNLFKTSLEALGYRVLPASDGQEAWNVFAGNHKGIDLIILDAVMPRLSGPQLYEKIRGLRPDIPCLFVSGYSEEINRKYFTRSLDVPLFQKPVDFHRLGKKVRELLEQGAADAGSKYS